MSSILLAAAIFGLACVTIPAVASADLFGPISLASTGVTEGAALPQQADYARDPVISADARYVVFDGSYGGVQGVWRRDLESDAIEAVTVCETESDPHPTACDAELPSVSADGRYVSFTTTSPLTGEDTNPGPDVYVRDMDRHGQEAYALASAVDGGSEGLTYEPTGKLPISFEEEEYGAVAAGRTAISADGSRVAFVTTAISNLAGKETPALQVALRDLKTDRTQLVSAMADRTSGAPEPGQGGLPKPVSGTEGEITYGAVFSPGSVPPRYSTSGPYTMGLRVGASISADGTTVAWMGQDVGLQTRVLGEETLAPVYAEPLWRRVADGPSAPTRRITGGGDPSSQRCIASGETQPALPASPVDPCQGPFAVEVPLLGTFSEVAADSVPQLSADGFRVAFLANAPLIAEGGDFGVGIGGLHTDVYLADMSEGLTRTQSLSALTELAGANIGDIATDAPAVDLGISPNGRYVAFATKRTVFPLASPAYVSPPASQPGMVELFDVDLGNHTLTRVTEGFDGAPEHPHEAVAAGVDPYTGVSDGALSPSFSGDGQTLAFSSTASNLVYGDGNTPARGASGQLDGADAFIAKRVVFPDRPTTQEISTPPALPQLEPSWRLGVTQVSRRDGSVLLYVQGPTAGEVRARASAKVSARARRRRRERRVPRTVSTASAASQADGPARILLTLEPSYRALAARPGGLSGNVAVTFSVAGRRSLRANAAVRFVRARRAPAPKHGRAR